MKKVILTVCLALGLAAASWWLVQAFDDLEGKLSMATASQVTLETELVQMSAADFSEETDSEKPDEEDNSTVEVKAEDDTEPEQISETVSESETETATESEETNVSDADESLDYDVQMAETVSDTAAGTVSEVNTQTETETESDAAEQAQEETSSNPAVPVITLNCTEAYLTVGDTFDIRDYVESVTDDVDNIYELYRNISISGDYDLNQPGRYTLTITVADSSGYVSVPRYLTLIVAAG